MSARIMALSLALCTLLGVVACDRTAPRLAPLAQEGVVLAFGDSLTYGTGAPAQSGYPAVLSELSGRAVVNAGIPGETSGQGRERLEAVLEEVQPQLLILCLGGNDFLRRIAEQEVRSNLQAMIRTAKARGVEVVLVAVPRLGFGLQVPSLYGELAKEENLVLEDEVLEDILSESRLKSDAIHPNAEGYRRMAAALHALLRRHGAL